MDENIGQINFNHVGKPSYPTRRVVLGQIDTKSQNIGDKPVGNNKKIGLTQRQPNALCVNQNKINITYAKTVKPNCGNKPVSKTNKNSGFSIYCDQPDKIEQNFQQTHTKDDENEQKHGQQNDLQMAIAQVKGNESTQSKNLMAMKSLVLEEEEEEEKEEEEKTDLTCDESMMTIENEDDENENDDPFNSSLETVKSVSSFDNFLITKCLEYSNDIHLYLLEFERKNLPDPYYMAKQPEINQKMRSILMDWMVEVSIEYGLLDETLFLAASCIDRFLSMMSISRQSFQLLGTAALFIASKYEEIYPPDINEFVYITDDSYSKEQILNMEKLILKVLQFDISCPTIHYFHEKYFSNLSLPKQVKHMSQYLCYLTLLESEPFLQYYPSEIALVSLLLAAHTLGYYSQIPEQLIEDSLVYEKKINNGDAKGLLFDRQSCMDAMLNLHRYSLKHPQQAIQQKYSTDKFNNVSSIEAVASAPRI